MQYTGTAAEQQEQYKKALADYQYKANQAMNEAGVKVGDKVSYHAVGSWNQVEVYEGILYLTKKGEPRVRLINRKSMRWHKGFKLN